MAVIATPPKLQFFDANGNPLVGGKLYSYAAGTVTPLATFTNAGGATPNANPVILDSRGEASVWLGSAVYKFKLTTSTDVDVWTVDNIAAENYSVLADLASTASASLGAGLVGYSDTLAYGSTTVGAVLRGQGRVLRGADPTGVVDNTALFKALLDGCIAASTKAIIPAGTYKVSGPITETGIVAAGSLHIECTGNVTITVDAAATAFQSLIVCQSTAINSSTIKGGRLTLNLNNKCGTGIFLSHDATSDGGLVDWEDIEVNNTRMVGIAAEATALAVFGRYTLGKLGLIRINGVDRSGVATASKGISINEIAGPFTVDTVHVSNVLSTGYSADADGVSVFGRDISGTYANRGGSVRIRHLVAEDCQGRSCKFQLQDAIIETLTIKRRLVVSFNVPDVDFQVGDGTVMQALLEYRLNGGTSPLGATFYPFSIQQQCNDRPNRARIQNVVLRSEIGMPHLVAIDIAASALTGETYVENVNLQPLGSFATTFFTRCVVEFDAGEVAASTGTTHISVRGVRGDMEGVPIIGHTGFGASVATKLSLEAENNNNTGTFTAANKTIAAVSGSDIPQFLSFKFCDNAGFHALMMATFTFNTQTLADGCRFSYTRATATVTNGPVIAAGTFVDVECLGSINGTSRKVRMTVDNAGTMDEHYTQSGAWGVIK